MKNKVLRLAIVAILVVAMVLSMAACGPTTPVEPTPTPGQTSPTPAPTTPTPKPTVPPVVPGATDEALAKATYGIELIGTNFTYGKILEDMSKPVSTTNKSLSTVKLDYSKTLMQNFDKPTVKWTVEYEGEGKPVNGTDYPDTSTYAGYEFEFAATAPAGTYTVTATVKTKDLGFNFGRFGVLKDENQEYELATIVNVAKADLTIKTPSYVAPVENATKAPTSPTFVKVTADDPNTAAEKELYANLVKAYGARNSYYYRADSMIDTTKVGSYGFVPSAHGLTATATEDNVIPFEELTSVNYNVTFENGKQYFVSAYDWNVIRDTATSILELPSQANTADGVKLARARYDALTAEQKVFFETGSVVAQGTAITYGKVFTAGTFKATTELATSATTGAAILKILTDAEKKAKDEATIAAFNKVATDAKFDLYMNDFNIDNATHVAAFNTVDKYFTGLSTADQDVITGNTDSATKVIYDKYVLAKAKFASKESTHVQTLISAAVAAYNRAVINAGKKGIFEDTLATAIDGTIKVGDNKYNGVVYYLNNAEVKAVTNQAKAAYDKLPKADRDALDVLEIKETEELLGTKNNFDVDVLFYGKALKALDTMNQVVGYMEQVINHTKIEDLFHTNVKSPAYSSLNAIVFGKNVNAQESDVDKSAYYINVATRTTYSAVGDIIRAFNVDSASLDAVVAEYKAMIDYVLAGETYKAEQIANLKAGIAAEFVSGNDYSEIKISTATSATNEIYNVIIDAIKLELGSTVNIKRVDPAATATLDTTRVVKKTVQGILNGTVESYDEAKEAFEGLYNMDNALNDFNKFFDYVKA